MGEENRVVNACPQAWVASVSSFLPVGDLELPCLTCLGMARSLSKALA